MSDTAVDTDTPTLTIPMDMVASLFEPWDSLDMAIAKLEEEARGNAGVPELVGAITAAREALRSPLYAVLRAYQAAAANAEADA